MILVAGGTGFLGSAIVRELVGRGEKVGVLSHRPEQAAAGFPGLDVEVRSGDARVAASLRSAVEGIEGIVSCMQFPNFPVEDATHGETFEEVDARGNERLVAAAQAAGVRSYVYLSGAGAASDGRYHWLRAKWRAEEAVRGSGIRHTILRPSWVYGPGDKSLNRFAGLARRLPFLPVIGNGRQRMQPVFVDDVARLTVDTIASDAAANKLIEIGGPEELTMDEVLRTMLNVMGMSKPLMHAPAFAPRAAGAVMEMLPLRQRPLSRDAVTFITMDTVADNGPLLAAFPQFPLTPLREGLASYLSPAPGA
ncbi:MAG TPA: NAD-dependent epimerase/dehydratase family protein [Dehalococcoidia bacterium]|nr:NAD-dependent epimerase/dehydratase family protein [Dehalococcoidia bacterium]